MSEAHYVNKPVVGMPDKVKTSANKVLYNIKTVVEDLLCNNHLPNATFVYYAFLSDICIPNL